MAQNPKIFFAADPGLPMELLSQAISQADLGGLVPVGIGMPPPEGEVERQLTRSVMIQCGGLVILAEPACKRELALSFDWLICQALALKMPVYFLARQGEGSLPLLLADRLASSPVWAWPWKTPQELADTLATLFRHHREGTPLPPLPPPPPEPEPEPVPVKKDEEPLSFAEFFRWIHNASQGNLFFLEGHTEGRVLDYTRCIFLEIETFRQGVQAASLIREGTTIPFLIHIQEKEGESVRIFSFLLGVCYMAHWEIESMGIGKYLCFPKEMTLNDALEYITTPLNVDNIDNVVYLFGEEETPPEGE